MGTLASFLLSWFSGPTLNFVSGIIKSLSSEHAAVVKAQAGLELGEAQAVVSAEIARQQVQGNVLLAMMAHPVFWWAWAMFVVPPAAYDAIIHIKSIVAPFYPAALAWNIPEVPRTIEDWDHYVILFFFGLGAASSVVSTIAGRAAAPK
jgi:hypothetical protein